MKRAGLYMRVSTNRQAQEGESIPAQREALNEYVRKHPGLIVVGEYVDDGISGTKYDRDEFQRMLSDVENGKIDIILVTKMDRLHRSLKNFLIMQDILDKHDCNWLAIWETMYDSSTPQGRMIINTMVNLAQFEAEQTGQRIRQVFAYKSQQGEVLSGKVPLGYKIEDKKIIKDSYAQIVLDTFEHYNFTENLYDTKMYLENIHGIVRTQSAVKKMLKNPKYKGTWYGIQNFCEPIVPPSIYDDVQRKLTHGTRCTAKRVYLFSGLLVCGTCGGRLTPQRTTEGMIYYRCRRHYTRDTQSCTNRRTINESTIEQRLLNGLQENLKNHVITIEATEEKPKNNKAKIDNINKKIERLKELYVNGLIDIDEYKADKQKYVNEIAKLMQDGTEVKDISRYKGLLKYNIIDLYKTFSQDERRFFWSSILKKIVFYDDRTTEPDFI